MADTLTRTFAGLPTAEPDEIGLSRSGLKRLTAVMEREIAAGRAPGLSMLIARNGKVGFTRTLGALGPHGPAMPPDAIFRIYSMTKPIVSVAAMMLVEEGRMLITDPLSEYIPAFAETKVGVENGDRLDLVPLKRPITIQDLMRHTSGLTYGFTGDSKVQEAGRGRELLEPGQNVRGGYGGAGRPAAAYISLERFGNTASRQTCSAASSRWLRVENWATFSELAFLSRSAWTTPRFSFHLASSRAKRSRCRRKST